MKKKIRIIILAIILLLGFCFLRDFLVKSIVGTVTTSITGAPTRIGGLSLSILRQSVKISNFRMYNPKGFPRDILVDIPRIKVACNFGSLLKGRLHIRELEVLIKEIGMAKNKSGELNVDSLKVGKPAKQIPIQIDIMTLGLGKVVSKDYSVGQEPQVKVYELNINKTYKNITSAQQLAVLIITEPLKSAGIHGLKVYGASLLSGAAALPVAAVLSFVGKDYSLDSFDVGLERAYNIGLEVLSNSGKVKKENKSAGTISAEVDGAAVVMKLEKITARSTRITVSARKFGLPKPEIAAGIMHQITRKLRGEK